MQGAIAEDEGALGEQQPFNTLTLPSPTNVGEGTTGKDKMCRYLCPQGEGLKISSRFRSL